MEPQARHGSRTIWVGLALTLLLLALAFVIARLKFQTARSTPPVYGKVEDFTLTNQHGQAVSLADLRGRVWVADIIFTRCAGPCLKMSRQLKDLQEALPPASQVRLVSLTTDPGYDQPAVLEAYAKRFGADPDRWMFLTGTKGQIARLASDSLKLSAVEKKPEERESAADLFIHSTIFVVVDKQARLRGIFQTMGEEVDPAKTKAEILTVVRRLERER